MYKSTTRAGVLALGLALLLVWAAGCAPPVVSPELMAQVDQKLTITQARKDPGAAKGQTVLWGGRIIRTVNKKKGTLIEVLQVPLDSSDRPKKTYESSGRFIVAMSGFLDPEIYHKNREVTVVGEIVGVESLPVGEVKYRYVLLRGKEVKLWQKRPAVIWPQDPYWGPMPPPGPYPYWYGAYPWW
ncbi:MAG: Slp family lipoprotein [Desulfarculaceae bacterium]|nr:Slp family lipoprotein [Desulfarculaceae bacterium]